MGLLRGPGFVPRPISYEGMDNARRRITQSGELDESIVPDNTLNAPAENWFNRSASEIEPAAGALFETELSLSNAELYDVIVSFSRTSDETGTYEVRISGGGIIDSGAGWDGTPVSLQAILGERVMADGILQLSIQRTAGGAPATRITGVIEATGFSL